jgi:ribonuclease HI
MLLSMSVTERTTVFTDGACSGNPGPGGWAWAVPGGRFASGYKALTTNQEMELTAAVQALGSVKGPIHLVTDSTYVKNCFRDRWYLKWRANGWRTTARKPVKYVELWKPLIEAFESGRMDEPEWVKGHSGDVMNDLVDQLAVEACRLGRGVSGPA